MEQQRCHAPTTGFKVSFSAYLKYTLVGRRNIRASSSTIAKHFSVYIYNVRARVRYTRHAVLGRRPPLSSALGLVFLVRRSLPRRGLSTSRRWSSLERGGAVGSSAPGRGGGRHLLAAAAAARRSGASRRNSSSSWHPARDSRSASSHAVPKRVVTPSQISQKPLCCFVCGSRIGAFMFRKVQCGHFQPRCRI